jgi:hypothetical protein
MASPEVNTALRALLREKIHIQRGAVARLPTAQAERLRSPLDLGRLAIKPLARSPAALLQFWAAHPRGHVVIGPQRHGYQPGVQPVGRKQIEGVAWLAARRLLAEPGLAASIAHLLDHLLGSDGEPEAGWLSDGVGRTAAWQEVGRRLQRQFNLRYGPPEAAPDPRAYFAWGLASYLADHQALNAADPGLERLLRTTLFDPAFWRQDKDTQ